MKKILFISWDGPQTSYMEGLFFPIFEEIQKQSNFQFHVLQFTWANAAKIDVVKEAANQAGVTYTAAAISRKPIVSIGSFLTALKGTKLIQKYLTEHKIDILLPRSTFPAMIVNRLKHGKVKIVFDADGLAIDERVDFSGLSNKSLMYKFLKNEEKKLLKRANYVLTRSQKAIDIHVNTIGEEFRDKFYVVTNGRNSEHFKPSEDQRHRIRKTLKLTDDTILFVYCGSLGPQYGWEKMMAIFGDYHQAHPAAHFLILTGNIEFAEKNLDESLRNNCTIKSVPFIEVPNYLSAVDVAFAIRIPTYSMQGVAPIKLGEYLLMGVPTIASKGIGDSEEILNNIEGNYLFDHQDPENIQNAITFVENLKDHQRELREAGITYFSIENSAKSYIKALDK
ncbi:glycosyltransferase [Bizionia paragorgiae]|uniref:glycosyltransferase n=1 Tax=Bizionia paragorgiae TaxID=283786 RepID=UPI003A95BE1F